jgi:diguanylate cyclase (GGDEF)-like protein
MQITIAADAEALLGATAPADGDSPVTGIILLDLRLPGMASGQLLARLHEQGARRRCALAVVAEYVTEEWLARLREGAIDDIVPLHAHEEAWQTHMLALQRGHALYCELQSLRELALVEVEHDRVTGVLNRATIMRILFRETDRVQRLRGNLSVMLLDLDGFGRCNTDLGFEAGDAVLREVGSRLSRIVRSYDMVGRTGPDEFLLILPGCGVIDAMLLAERMQSEVFGIPFLVTAANGKPAELHMQATFAIGASGGRSPVVVLREAEQTLAVAKRGGPGAIRSTQEASACSANSEGSVPKLFPDPKQAAVFDPALARR